MGQPKINTYINFKNLAPRMLHNKLEGFQPSCSGEKDFLVFFLYIYIYGNGGHFAHVT